METIEVHAFCISYEKCKISGGQNYVASCLTNAYQYLLASIMHRK